MRNTLKRFILRALDQMGGQPISQIALFAAVRSAFPTALESEITAAHKDLESDGFVAGARDDLDSQVTWTLTTKGQHKANAIR